MSGYTDAVEILENLPALVRNKRLARGLSMPAAAREIGLSHVSVLWRFERGAHAPTLATATAMIRWLDTPNASSPDDTITPNHER